MFQVVLKDGSKRDFDQAVTGEEVARCLSPRLAKEAVAVRVNGQLWDVNRLLPDQAHIDIITRNDPEGLEVIRHDTAHVTAEAVKELYPETQITIGPAIENGFYYDFHREAKFTPDDLTLIEARIYHPQGALEKPSN